jgi:hypothetical protein
MMGKRPQPPRPDRIRSIGGSFSWIDHRFFRQGFDQGLTRLEKLLYLVLIAVSNRDGVSFYSDERLGEILEIRHRHELTGAREELVARDLIAFKDGVYQVLDLRRAEELRIMQSMSSGTVKRNYLTRE